MALFYLDGQRNAPSSGSALTGALSAQTPEDLSILPAEPAPTSLATAAESSPTTNDVQVWQGQYYTGKTFNVGTYEFNFTAYDAAENGTACYSNLTTITTGNFGEWRTEQREVGATCNDAAKNYYLEIIINNETQSPRRLIKSFEFLRKDVNDELKGQIKIISSIKSGTSQPAGLTLSNTITEKTTSTSFRLQNEIGKFIAISMGSNKTSFGGIEGNQGTISYTGGNVFSFSALNVPASWLWRITMAPTLGTVTIDKLMELTKTGSLIIYHGNLDVNGSINATQNISASYFIGDGSQLINLPSSNATSKNYTNLSNFTNDMSFINSTQAQVYNDTLLISSVNTTLENNKVPYTGATNNLNLGNFNIVVNMGLFSNLNTTNITAVQYNSVDAGESKTGMTSSQFRVCTKFKVPENACEEWCKLEITGGIITGCK